MNKKVLFIIGIILFLSGCFIGFYADGVIKNRSYEKMEWDYLWEIDSLKQLENIREEAQLPYYGRSKDEVMQMFNGKVTIDSSFFYLLSGKIYGTDSSNPFFMLHPRYLNEELSKDTLWLFFLRIKNPFNQRSVTHIVFEKTDSGWYANSCMEYNPKEILF